MRDDLLVSKGLVEVFLIKLVHRTYLVVFGVLGIKFRGCYMVAVIPVQRDQMAIVCKVFGDLFFSNFKTVFVLKVAICQPKHLLGLFASQRGLALRINCHGRSKIF